MPAFKLAIPSWLASLFIAVAAFLKGYSQGRDDQAKEDTAAAQQAAANAKQVAEKTAEEVKKLDPAAVQKELKEWQAPE